MAVIASSALCAAPLVSAGCESPAPLQTYEFTLRVLSDPNEPLAGATVSRGRITFGTSDEQGRVSVRVRGREGERLAIDVSCPDGYRSPEAPVTAVLRQASHGRVAEYETRCPPLRRKVVVAVRAERGANLPIRYLSREVGRTDQSGAALVLLESFTDDTLELTLDTSEEPRLLPRSPSTRFRVPDHDDIVLLNQRFALEARAVQRVRRHKASGPIRIQ